MTIDTPSRQRLLDLCRSGYALLDQGRPDQALRHFYRAWLLLPAPQTDHEESAWVLTAIGDAYLAQQRFPLAVESFRSALCCQGNENHPLIRFKLGQCLYELDQRQEAKTLLARALREGGERVFEGQHRKYLTLARSA